MNSCLSCKNRLMYPFVDGISVSLICIPFSKAQDSGFHQKNWYPGFQNPYSSTWGDKRSHRTKLQMAYCDENKQNGWKSTKTQPTDVNLFRGMAFAQVSHWMFLTCETACPLPLSRPQASRAITMPTCIFNHKRDLFFSERKHSALFAVTTVAQCFKKKFCTV